MDNYTITVTMRMNGQVFTLSTFETAPWHAEGIVRNLAGYPGKEVTVTDAEGNVITY